ncbi:MAG: hypothetical protein AAF891_06990 [Pseudomonadota bacterium]
MVNPSQARSRAEGRIRLNLARSRARGLSRIIASEENILGTMRHNFATTRHKPGAGDRVARYVSAFGGEVSEIILSIRSLDSYWASALTYSLPRGHQVPGQDRIARLVQQPRNWRDVIADIAAAAQGVPLFVSPYERMVGQPDVLLEAATGTIMPACREVIWRNARPALPELLRLPLSDAERTQLTARSRAGRWHPLTDMQKASLQDRYADDIFWLRTGADGLATYLEEHESMQAKAHLPHASQTRGQKHEQGYQLARPG